MAKKKKPQTELNLEILVGFVNSFNFKDKEVEQALGGHPKPGRLYQVIKDSVYGHRLHIGAGNNPAGMEGILLGDSLVGDHDGKWEFDVSIVDKENFFNFNIHEDDTVKLGEWFETENKDLKESLSKPVAVVSQDQAGNFIELPAPEDFALQRPEKVYPQPDEKRYMEFADNINKISDKDPELYENLIDLIAYLSTTYGDKYESSGRPNIAKEFLLTSDSPDATIFNSMKYMQRYCTTGFEKSRNIKDLYKAVHYVLFELQRNKRNEQK